MNCQFLNWESKLSRCDSLCGNKLLIFIVRLLRIFTRFVWAVFNLFVKIPEIEFAVTDVNMGVSHMLYYTLKWRDQRNLNPHKLHRQ